MHSLIKFGDDSMREGFCFHRVLKEFVCDSVKSVLLRYNRFISSDGDLIFRFSGTVQFVDGKNKHCHLLTILLQTPSEGPEMKV